MSVINFGKYKGKEVSKIDDYGYLVWLVKRHREQASNPDEKGFKIPDDVAAEANAVLNGMGKNKSRDNNYRKSDGDEKPKIAAIVSTIMGEIDTTKESVATSNKEDMTMFYIGYEAGLKFALEALEKEGVVTKPERLFDKEH